MMGLRRNVLLFHQAALGDFVLTWPLALAMSRLYPQSRVLYVTHAGKGALAERAIGVEWIDAEAGWHNLYGDPAKLPDRARRALEGAHCIIRFGGDADDAWWQHVNAIAGADKVQKIHVQPPTTAGDVHASQFILDQLKPVPIVHAAVEQLLNWFGQTGVQVQRRPEQVLIHPGAGSPAKCWPIDRYITLAKELASAGEPVRFLLGEVEHDRFKPNELAALTKIAEVIPTGTVLDLLTALTAAKLFIGNDSGPGHLAGVLGVPTVALFGPTDPNVWRPMGPRVHTIAHQPLAELAVDDVLAVAGTMLSDAAGASAGLPADPSDD